MDDMLYGNGNQDSINLGKRHTKHFTVSNSRLSSHRNALQCFISALGFRSLPRNLAMGVLRSGGMGRKLSPVSKYGTKPRPGRRLPRTGAKAASKTESSLSPRRDDLPDIRCIAQG